MTRARFCLDELLNLNAHIERAGLAVGQIDVPLRESLQAIGLLQFREERADPGIIAAKRNPHDLCFLIVEPPESGRLTVHC